MTTDPSTVIFVPAIATSPFLGMRELRTLEQVALPIVLRGVEISSLYLLKVLLTCLPLFR